MSIWRKLKRYGSLPLGNSGYLLPNNPENREKFEWLATTIRGSHGEASVLAVESIDNYSDPGEDCTFETLTKAFRVGDKRVAVMVEIVHDADLFDEKFGRKEGFGIDEVMKGWARQNLSDAQLLECGCRWRKACMNRCVPGEPMRWTTRQSEAAAVAKP